MDEPNNYALEAALWIQGISPHQRKGTPPPSRVSEPDECAANGATGHSFGPHGPNGEIQCRWCGEPAA